MPAPFPIDPAFRLSRAAAKTRSGRYAAVGIIRDPPDMSTDAWIGTAIQCPIRQKQAPTQEIAAVPELGGRINGNSDPFPL